MDVIQPSHPATAAIQPRPPSIWRNRDFKVILFGQGISNLGDAVSATALPLLVLFLTGSGVQMGLVGMLQMLPHIFFGLPAGALADRWDRRRTMLLCDLGRALLAALIPLSLLLDVPMMPVIYAVAMPLAMLAILFGAAYSAAVPTLVGREQIGPASSNFEAIESLSWIVGPGVTGLLATLVGPGPTLAIDALSFLASAVSLRLVRRQLQLEQPGAQVRILRDVWEGITFIRRHPLLRTLLAYRAVERISLAPIIPALTFYLVVDRRMEPSAVGFAVAVYAGGSLLGTLMAGRLTHTWIGRLMLACGAGMGVASLLLGQSGTLPLILPAAFAFGVAEGLELVLYLTARATATQDALLGRVTSTFTTVILGFGSLGMLLGGLLMDRTDGSTTLTIMGSLVLITTLGFGCLPALRNARAR